jgi:hypothetical protein
MLRAAQVNRPGCAAIARICDNSKEMWAMIEKWWVSLLPGTPTETALT